MTGWHFLVGQVSGEPITYGGHVLVHADRDELAWLFPNVRVAELPRANTWPTMKLIEHPDLAHLTWPLDRRDFR